jgi:hypothetical protein
MADKRYSVMILHWAAGKVLLQSLESDGKTAWDGFGSFYSANDSAKETALQVFVDNFKDNMKLEGLVEKAKLKYIIDKPSGLVDLDTTIYFANVGDKSLDSKNAKWFEVSQIPYAQMHAATSKWLPILIEKKALVTATIRVDQPGGHTQGSVAEFTVNSG